MSQITRLVPTSGPGSGSVTSVSGGNNITITGDPTVNPTVNVSGTTNHAVQVGNASGSLTSIPVGLTGQVLTGVTGGDPVFAAPPASGVTSITGNTGAAQTGAISLVTANSTPIFAGSAGTITLDFDLTSNLLLGANAVGLAGGTDNVGYGRNAGEALTTGSSNTFIGSFAGFQHTNSSNSTGIGAFALAGEVAGGGGNTALGSQALQSVATGDFNLGLGFNGGGNYNGNESFNIAIANAGVIGESNVIRIGTNAQQTSAYIVGIDGVNVGSTAKVVTLGAGGTADQLGTATITAGAGITITPGANTITIDATGGGGGAGTITGNTGLAQPQTAGNWDIITASSTVLFNGGSSTLTLEFNPANIMFGSSGPSITTGARNNTMGSLAGDALVDGVDNTLIGDLAGRSFASEIGNTAIGAQALTNASAGTNYCTAVGYQALTLLTTNAGSNVAIGTFALGQLDTGIQNTALGYSAGSNYTTNESDNICIGHLGVATDNGVIRIGTTGVQLSFFAAGIDGTNVGSVATVVTEASDQLGTAVLTAGADITITPGANVITIASSGTSTLTVTSVNNAASPYTVLSTDSFLAVNTSGGAVTIRLPNAPATGRVFYVKDSNGTAAASNITVTTVGGAVNIDGATSFVMNTAYESISVVFDGTAYEVF